MRVTAQAPSASPRAGVEQAARSPADQVEDLLALYDGDFRHAMLDCPAPDVGDLNDFRK